MLGNYKGIETRLDLDFVPPAPVKPDWVQRLEASLVVTPSVAVKPSGSSVILGKPRQPGEMNFFTYLNPLERDVVLPQYKAFLVSSSNDPKARPRLELVVTLLLRPRSSDR